MHPPDRACHRRSAEAYGGRLFLHGTNQVDLKAAKVAGIPVFNAPYSNTRSVAELVLGEMIMLYRGVPEKSAAAPTRRWLKTAKGSHEVRGNFGYGSGHIGSQQTRDMIGAAEIERQRWPLAEGHLGGDRRLPQRTGEQRRGVRLAAARYSQLTLTPHVGGSTQEGQANIDTEVADKLVTYSDNGSTLGTVNFMGVVLLVQGTTATHFMHTHRNGPSVISRINDILSGKGINISGQYLHADGEVGYVVVVDVEAGIEPGQGFRKALDAIGGTIRLRFLF